MLFLKLTGEKSRRKAAELMQNASLLVSRNECLQGALWVYESLLGPGLRRARTELSKFPALEKALTQFDQTINAPVGVSLISLSSKTS